MSYRKLAPLTVSSSAIYCIIFYVDFNVLLHTHIDFCIYIYISIYMVCIYICSCNSQFTTLLSWSAIVGDFLAVNIRFR